MRTRGNAFNDAFRTPPSIVQGSGYLPTDETVRDDCGRTRGLLIVYTGDGKGKTSAALGTLLRARGWKLRVAMYQFVKSSQLDAGEHRAARELGVEITPLGHGFVRGAHETAEARACVQAGWARCRRVLSDPSYDAVILDEITYPVCLGWLSAEEVLRVLRVRPCHQHVILTGRQAPAAWIEAADLVTEMRECKHPYRAGVPAQRGIEF